MDHSIISYSDFGISGNNISKFVGIEDINLVVGLNKLKKK